MSTVACLEQSAELGGAELALCNQIRHIKGVQWVALLGEHGQLENRLRLESVRVEVLMLPRSLRTIRQNSIRVSSFANARRIAAASTYVVRLIRECSRSKVQLVHINSMRMGPLGLAAGRLLRVPVVWQVHSVPAPPAMSLAGASLTRFVARHVDHVICPSAAVANALGNVRGGRLSVVPNGIDATRFPMNGFDQPARVGMIARLAPVKGQEFFLEAAALLASKRRNVDFLVAGAPLFGEGHYETELLRRRTMLRSPVRFLGHVDDVPALLNEVGVYVHASITAEGHPLSLIEAMMAGKAVVATAPGGPSEMIEDGVTGRLIPPGDAAALAGAVEELLDDPEAARAMGRRAREVALERYDIRKTAPMIENIYESVLARRKERSFAPA